MGKNHEHELNVAGTSLPQYHGLLTILQWQSLMIFGGSIRAFPACPFHIIGFWVGWGGGGIIGIRKSCLPTRYNLHQVMIKSSVFSVSSLNYSAMIKLDDIRRLGSYLSRLSFFISLRWGGGPLNIISSK